MGGKGKNRVKVTINGEEYYMKGSVSPEYMKKIADYVDKKMTKLSESNPYLSFSKIAVLAALNITDELFKLREEFEEFLKLVEDDKK
ncbi:Cell division protein ZapA [Koleobacter methoxysyntrophicus]|jgi:cell division protein ZapA|uniref:Cell division protein ZapA n=1 Tax=Koleobacter methoxysyntrophicus TaxID=2751313 RepID=A0A8A0RRE2_9FIRM|nr:cell division protein ZapA [Koleobacter methoxysyntrophicus]MDI3540468.1 cell division protein ZapA [Thermosediminibacterales bacterium]MDK2901681.1 cell division protein ZapA [Thermosediminibacterales bacterium]QSQ09957.1 Cell division protein ZapA [Koleobacter methoxysyntrophicus]